MPTSYVDRLLIMVPVASVASVVSWFQANIGPNSVPSSFGPGCNSTGLAIDPVTYNWLEGSYTDTECMNILFHFCQLASVVPPSVATWNGWTQAQKIAWLQSVQGAIKTGCGIWVDMCDNTTSWMNATSEAMVQCGVQPMAAPAFQTQGV